MAQYDGSIRINTKIDSKEASAQLMTLENRIVKTADKVAALRSKMDSLKDTKIPTAEYQEISAQISKAEIEFNKLLEKQEQMQREGKDNGVAWDRLNAKMDEVGSTIRHAQGELQDLIDTGKAFTLGKDSEEFAKLGQQLQYAESDMAVLNKRHDELIEKQGKASDGYKKLGKSARNSAKIANKATKSMSDGFKVGFKNILKYGFGIRSLYVLINKLRAAIKEGFGNFYNANENFRNSVDSLKASLLTLKNSFAAAFAPLVQTVIPYIQNAVEWITALINKVGQLIAAISGQKSYTKAIKQTTAAIKDQNKAQNKQLSSLDKLNNLSSDSGGGGGADSAGMFEEVSVDSQIPSIFEKIAEYAQKLKDIFSQGFLDGLGDWEYRWESIKSSIASIKDNLINIWTDPAVLAAADKWAQSVAYMLGSLVGSSASIGLTIATNLLGGIEKYLEQNKDRIKEYLISMFNIRTETNMMFSELFHSISYVFEAFASEQGQQLTANIIGIFTDAFMGITELASKLFLDIANIIMQPFVDNKEALRVALEGFLGVLASVAGTIKDGIDATFDKLKEVYDAHFKPFFDSVATGLSDTAGKFLEFWNGQVQPVLDEWAGKFDIIWQEHIQPMLNNFIDLIGDAADILKFIWENVLNPLIDWIITYIAPVILHIIDMIFSVFSSVFGVAFVDIINGVISVIRGLIEFMSGSFTNDWKKIWSGIGKIVDGVGTAIKGIVNGIIGVIEALANGVVDGVNTVIRSLNGLHFSIPYWIPGIGGNSFGFSIPEVPQVSIPRLATGTVVPPNREFLAMLGDNKREPEIVSPISTMKQAVKEAIAESGIASGSGNDCGDIVVMIDGREVFRAVKKQASEYKKQNGGKPAFS